MGVSSDGLQILSLIRLHKLSLLSDPLPGSQSPHLRNEGISPNDLYHPIWL